MAVFNTCASFAAARQQLREQRLGFALLPPFLFLFFPPLKYTYLFWERCQSFWRSKRKQCPEMMETIKGKKKGEEGEEELGQGSREREAPGSSGSSGSSAGRTVPSAGGGPGGAGGSGRTRGTRGSRITPHTPSHSCNPQGIPCLPPDPSGQGVSLLVATPGGDSEGPRVLSVSPGHKEQK